MDAYACVSATPPPLTGANRGAARPSDGLARACTPILYGQPLVWKDPYYLGISWNSLTWNNLTWNNLTWDNLAWDNLAWDNLAWDNLAWDNLAWDNLAWDNWPGTTWPGTLKRSTDAPGEVLLRLEGRVRQSRSVVEKGTGRELRATWREGVLFGAMAAPKAILDHRFRSVASAIDNRFRPYRPSQRGGVEWWG